jgi:hypothetical protein
VLSLDVSRSRTAPGALPAIRPTDKTLTVYSKDVALARLEGRVLTAAVTFRADERGGRLWLARLDDPQAP